MCGNWEDVTDGKETASTTSENTAKDRTITLAEEPQAEVKSVTPTPPSKEQIDAALSSLRSSVKGVFNAFTKNWQSATGKQVGELADYVAFLDNTGKTATGVLRPVELVKLMASLEDEKNNVLQIAREAAAEAGLSDTFNSAKSYVEEKLAAAA